MAPKQGHYTTLPCFTPNQVCSLLIYLDPPTPHEYNVILAPVPANSRIDPVDQLFFAYISNMSNIGLAHISNGVGGFHSLYVKPDAALLSSMGATSTERSL